MILRNSTLFQDHSRAGPTSSDQHGEGASQDLLHSVRTFIHSDGVWLIILLDHRLFGLALSSQIPPFRPLFASRHFFGGHNDRIWNSHKWPPWTEVDNKERINWPHLDGNE